MGRLEEFLGSPPSAVAGTYDLENIEGVPKPPPVDSLPSKWNRPLQTRQDIEDYIREKEAQYPDLPSGLAPAIISAESSWRPSVMSHDKLGNPIAYGLMQLTPKTAARFGVGNILDPKENIDGGFAYLNWLHNHYQGDTDKTIAAYNAGEDNIDAGIVPAETQKYLPRVKGFWGKLGNALVSSASAEPRPQPTGKLESFLETAPFVENEAPTSGGNDLESFLGPPSETPAPSPSFAERASRVNLQPIKPGNPPAPDFFERVGQAEYDLYDAARKQDFDIAKIGLGTVDAAASGLAKFGGAVGSTIAGLEAASLGKLLGLPESAANNFSRVFESTQQALHDRVPLEPEAPTGKEQLGLAEQIFGIPHAVGETVFEKTGSPLLGAGVEALGNLAPMLLGRTGDAPVGTFTHGGESEFTSRPVPEPVPAAPIRAAPPLATPVDETAVSQGPVEVAAPPVQAPSPMVQAVAPAPIPAVRPKPQAAPPKPSPIVNAVAPPLVGPEFPPQLTAFDLAEAQRNQMRAPKLERRASPEVLRAREDKNAAFELAERQRAEEVAPARQSLEDFIGEPPVPTLRESVQSKLPPEGEQTALSSAFAAALPKAGELSSQPLARPRAAQLLPKEQPKGKQEAALEQPRVEGPPITEAEAQPRVRGFTTTKGSSYTIDAEGRTTRDKAARPEQPGEQGPQPTSERTYYVTSEQADRLGEIQAIGPYARRIATTSDGRLGVQYLEGPDKGRFESRTVVEPQSKPAIGLTPVELWKGGRRVHFGNEINSLDRGGSNAPTEARIEPVDDIEQHLGDGRVGPPKEASGGGELGQRQATSGAEAPAPYSNEALDQAIAEAGEAKVQPDRAGGKRDAGGRRGRIRDLDEEFNSLKEQWKSLRGGSAGAFGGEHADILTKLVQNRVEAGIRKFPDVARDIARHLGESVDAISEHLRRAWETVRGTVPGLGPAEGEIRADNGPIFYSGLERAVENLPNARAPAKQWLGSLKNLQGVSEEELATTGVREWLEKQTGSLMKEEVLDHIRENSTELTEKAREERSPLWDQVNEDAGTAAYTNMVLPGPREGYKELLLKYKHPEGAPRFYEGHFGENDVLAHVRFDERTDSEGRQVLAVHEIQSNLHARGAREGYFTKQHAEKERSVKEAMDRFGEAQEAARQAFFGDAPPDEILRLQGIRDAAYDELSASEGGRSALRDAAKVPDAPFKKSYPLLAAKRILRYAAEHGFDRVTLPSTPEQVAKIEGWGKLIKTPADLKAHVVEGLDGTFDIESGSGQLLEIDFPDRASAEKALSKWQSDQYQTAGDRDVTGIVKQYTEELPRELRKYVEKWGGGIGKTTLEGHEVEGRFRGTADDSAPTGPASVVHSFDIPPAMRESVLSGQPMFGAKPKREQLLDVEFARLKDEFRQFLKEHAGDGKVGPALGPTGPHSFKGLEILTKMLANRVERGARTFADATKELYRRLPALREVPEVVERAWANLRQKRKDLPEAPGGDEILSAGQRSETGRVREEMNLPEREPRETSTYADERRQAIKEKVPENAEKVALRALAGGTPLSKVEIRGVHEKVAQNLVEHRRTMAALDKARDPAQIEDLNIEARRLEGQSELLLRALENTFSIGGSILRAARDALKANFEPAMIRGRAKAEKGADLTPEETKFFDSRTKQIGKLDDSIARDRDARRAQTANNAIRAAASKKAKSRQQLWDEYNTLVKRARELAKAGCKP